MKNTAEFLFINARRSLLQFFSWRKPHPFLRPPSRCWLGCALLWSLAACGGGGATPVALAPTTLADRGPYDRGYIYVAEANGGQFRILRNDGSVITMQRNDVGGLPDDFESFRNQYSSQFYLGGQTADGTAQAVSGIVEYGPAEYQLNRFTETTLPPTSAGSASYSGTYAGQYRRSSGGNDRSFGHMFGDAQMEADFAENLVSGRITNRVNSGGMEARDIVLRQTDLADGAFAGQTFGGSFLGGTSSIGEYRGLVVGENGEEIVGHVSVNSALNSARYIESGIFILADE